ncbi:N-acetylmannosamine-6-phosphate 2-epimerase [Escherichia coli]|nr:N-acetylmannosamine-6-phosphate 2-epimerase [Escherichia coli]EGJ4563757.1 N-acetylmannosamine-6-phosphate 2-epimerase [Escherichia coli]EGO0724453.1 N-acetylmannosamine-6-phosphate 2-epimerase [Escherichia coli]EGO0804258.1 N-acetylmannosamine-6-phosphate 2-epimerase [Escherichia coli]EIH4818068.1 N-acetylmannosamine-6-phosphate 2-epimerase [Escherichia coli]
MLLQEIESQIRVKGGLIVSCQPVPGSPMDSPEIIAAMALAAEQAGAVALRIEGAVNLAEVRKSVSIPIIGIIKRDLTDSPVRITPFLNDVDALAEAGADIIAFDGTDRVRPASVEALIRQIHNHHCIAMADCSSEQDGLECHALGADIIGTTLSGYTGDSVPDEPDFELVSKLSLEGCRVIAEGRYNSPLMAAEAMKRGAWAVTVGSAITRLEHICRWYCDAMLRVAV